MYTCTVHADVLVLSCTHCCENYILRKRSFKSINDACTHSAEPLPHAVAKRHEMK